MNQERIYKILLGPRISEKAILAADNNSQYLFKVAIDANKIEIKRAVEKLFEVKVTSVRTLRMKGKVKRTAKGVGRRPSWKKAYVALAQGHTIDFVDAE